VIISFRHHFIFVAIPKTASHAIRAVLRPHLGRYDWEQCLLLEPRAFPVAPLAALQHGHLTCQQVRPFLLGEFWDTARRFCVVRNPYDRFVSYCRFVNRDNARMRDDPLATMKATIRDPRTAGRMLFRPQHEFVTDDSGTLLATDVCRFETLQHDIDTLCARLSLPSSPLPHLNRSQPGTSRVPFDAELADLVQAFYDRDFSLFDYSRDHDDADAGRTPAASTTRRT
jgi:hypothetical protein